MTTFGSAFIAFIVIYTAYKTIQTEKARNTIWTGAVIFFFVMLWLNKDDAVDLTISESKNWWPIIVDMIKNFSAALRDLLTTLQGGS